MVMLVCCGGLSSVVQTSTPTCMLIIQPPFLLHSQFGRRKKKKKHSDSGSRTGTESPTNLRQEVGKDRSFTDVTQVLKKKNSFSTSLLSPSLLQPLTPP